MSHVHTHDDASSVPRGRRPLSPVLRFLRDLAIILIVALLVSFLLKTFLVRSFYIPSVSMQPTLQIDDRIIVNELVPGVVPIARGDVVVFRDPGGWLNPPPAPEQSPFLTFLDGLGSFVGLTAPDSGEHLVKRVIGLPGDTVACCDEFGRVVVNDIPVVEPYLQLPDGVTKTSREEFDVTVPEHAVWVMGDNRYRSDDSRYNGPVDLDLVVGRAVVVSWPLDHWTWLDDYPIVFAGLDDG